MEYSAWESPAFPLVSKPPDILYGKYFGLELDAAGKILSVEEKGNFSFPSMIEEMKKAGTVRAYFDLGAYRSLDDIPELKGRASAVKRPEDNPLFVTFANKRDFTREELPEAFYTTLPTTLLSVGRMGKDKFYGVVRPIPTLPDLYLERSNGIIYLDERERLIGFNETFFKFFNTRFKTPSQLLNAPAARLFSPTPGGFLREKLKNFRPLSLPGQKPVKMEGLHRNTGPDLLTLPLQADADTGGDFTVTVHCEALEGVPPLFIVSGPVSLSGYPDSNGYLVGPDASGSHFFLKRKGVVQAVGEKMNRQPQWNLTFQKTGNLLVLREESRVLLAFYDSNILEDAHGKFLLALRKGAVCRFNEVRLASGTRDNPAPADAPPIVKLTTPEQRFFILNRLSHVGLASSFPACSAFVLENITEIQKQVHTLERQFDRLRRALDTESDGFVGKSEVIKSIKEKAALVAGSDTAILIQGPTGTGKEVLANFIHQRSPRKKGPLVKVDCSTLPRELMESELFGHEKGAFTGAVERKIGYLEQADQGTLFLDEVGNLTLETQAKLLQFLQDHKIVRVGGVGPISLNLRVIAAANIPLRELVEKGLFRADLYYRIDVVSISLPPLSERREDLAELCRHFINQFNRIHGKKILGLSAAAFRKMFDYDWPGNIRELKNTVERAVIFSDGRQIGPDLITFSPVRTGAPAPGRKAHRFLTLDPPTVERLLKKHGGVLKDAARELDVDPRTLYYKLKRAGVSVKSLRNS